MEIVNKMAALFNSSTNHSSDDHAPHDDLLYDYEDVEFLIGAMEAWPEPPLKSDPAFRVIMIGLYVIVFAASVLGE